MLACSSGIIPRLSLLWHSLYGGVLLRRFSVSETGFVKFRSRTYRCRTFTKDLLCVWFCQMYGSSLNKGIIRRGVAVILCIMMAAFSVSVRFCCAGVRSWTGRQLTISFSSKFTSPQVGSKRNLIRRLM